MALLLGIATLVAVIADTLGASDKAQLEKSALVQARAAIAAEAPMLSISYLFLTPSLVYVLSERPRTRARRKTAATDLVSFPVIANSVIRRLNEIPDPPVRKCVHQADQINSVAFLVIRNEGRHPASNVRVRLNRLRLPGVARVQEGASMKRGYAAVLRERAISSSQVIVRVPASLGAGEGVLVPLFRTIQRFPYYRRWCVTSTVAYVPEIATFDDALSLKSFRQTIRAMRDPVILDYGVVGRG